MKFQEFLIVLFICGNVAGVRIYENTRNDTVITSTAGPTTQTTSTNTPHLTLDTVQYQLSKNISKESEQSVISNRETNQQTNNKKRESDEANQNESTKKFTPSQQYNFDYEQLKKSLPFNDFRPATPYYKPMKFDASYYSNSPWDKPSEQPDKLKIDYPKYTEPLQPAKYVGIAQQTTQNLKGNFNWLTNSELKLKEEIPEKLSGKWQWIPDEKSEVEPKVLSNIPFSFPEEIIEKQRPYTFDTGESPFNIQTTTNLPESQFPDVEDKGHVEIFRPRGLSPWSKILKLLTAVIPIGLLLSALTPRVIYVNPNMTQPATFTSPGLYPSRQRSLDDYPTETDDGRGRKLSNPLMDFLNVLGNEQLEDRGNSCENRYFCEMARLGARKNADVLYKMLWKISYQTPNEKAERNGLGEVFQAIKEDNCVIFDCETVIK